ncbi:hypothetical protein LJC46_03280 [Desulfovibrio sp. OttesenSCG-928-G15]|nr:hypothetical protein [Desulfovibrio sp. OttesenSCG-928-G15]
MSAARKVSYGVSLGTLAACRTCGYYREIPSKVRLRRLCMWSGEKLTAVAVTFDCAGYHAGEWGELWEV